MHRVGIFGGSGYTGLELTQLVAAHPAVELGFVASDRWVGEPVAAAPALRYVAPSEAAELPCDVALLATPAVASHELVPRLLARDLCVIDLSGAYRLRDHGCYPAHYGFAHAHPALLADAVYGLPELARDRIRGARLIANPGCYATAIALALAPIVALGPIGRLIVDALSGVTGAGRQASEEMSFAEVDGDVRAYRVLRHQHVPEIEQQLGAPITFVPHLLPIRRGILATCHAQLARTPPEQLAAAYERAYGAEPFVKLAGSAEQVGLRDVVGTNVCRIGWTVGAAGELVVTAAIDNLVKGAAGQAVQNLNLRLGLDETTGLARLRSFRP